MVNQTSVTDIVTMYAVREIGKNVPRLALTYFLDEAEEWRDEEPNLEVVSVNIQKYLVNVLDNS